MFHRIKKKLLNILRMKSFCIIFFTLVLLCEVVNQGWGLDCTPNFIKVTVRTSDPQMIDDNEQFLFQGIMAYAIRKYCSSPEPTLECPVGAIGINSNDVIIQNQTDRFAMCVGVNPMDQYNPTLLQEAIRVSQPRFNGGLLQTDETLLYEGVPVTLRPEVEPAFPTWLIPFIVFMALVIIAAIAIIAYTMHQSKKTKSIEPSIDDDSSLTNSVYENGGYKNDGRTITEL